MNFDDTIKFLEGSMKYVPLLDIMGPKRGNFEGIISEMKRQISYLAEDKPLYEFNREQFSIDIKDSANFLKRIYIETPVDKNIIEFVKAYCILVTNWNNNVLKDNDLNRDFGFLHRVYDGFFVAEELFMFCKVLLEKINLMKDFASPSVELSKLYLSMLDEKNKEGEK